MLKNFKLWRGLVVVFALVMSIFIVLTNLAYYYAGFVNDFFGITPPTVQTTDETNYYPAAHGEMNAENCKKLIADEDDFNIRAMEEGAVMLRNENNALPLKENERRVTFSATVSKIPYMRPTRAAPTSKRIAAAVCTTPSKPRASPLTTRCLMRIKTAK